MVLACPGTKGRGVVGCPSRRLCSVQLCLHCVVLWTPSCLGALGAALWPPVTAATSDLIKISFVCQCCLWFWGFWTLGARILPHSPRCLGPELQEGAGDRDKSSTCRLYHGRGCKQPCAGVIGALHLGAAPARCGEMCGCVSGLIRASQPWHSSCSAAPPCAVGCSLMPGSRPDRAPRQRPRGVARAPGGGSRERGRGLGHPEVSGGAEWGREGTPGGGSTRRVREVPWGALRQPRAGVAVSPGFPLGRACPIFPIPPSEAGAAPRCPRGGSGAAARRALTPVNDSPLGKQGPGLWARPGGAGAASPGEEARAALPV